MRPFLSPDELALYELIWKRFLASQMKPAVFDAVTEKRLLRRWLPDAAEVRRATRVRSARLSMKDGSIAAFWLVKKADDRTTLSVQPEKLPDRATQERVKRYWGERLGALDELLRG